MKLRTSLHRTSFWTPVIAFLVVLVLADAGLWLTSQRRAASAAVLHEHLDQLETLQASTAQIHDLLLERLERRGRLDPARLAQVGGALESLLLLDTYRAETTPLQLREAQRLFSQIERDPGATGLALLEILRTISVAERDASSELVSLATKDSRRLRDLTLLVGVGLPVAAGVTCLMFLRGVRRPLRTLERLMSDLGPTAVDPRDDREPLDPLVVPLYSKYDGMVARLEQLEHERYLREEDLERRVHEAAALVVAQQTRLNARERLAVAGELAAEVAHDLRSPLAGIEVAVSRLTREPELAAYRERLVAIKKEVGRAARRLTDLLERSRFEDEPASTVDLRPVVEDLVDLFRFQVPAKVTICCRVPSGTTVRLPVERFRLVLLNLLNNAVGSLSEGCDDPSGTVSVDIESHAGSVVIRVADDGPGFAPQVLQEGIRPFATYRDGGTGLGLVVVRRFAADLGGRLALSNRSEGGALVQLTIPQSPTTAAGEEATTA